MSRHTKCVACDGTGTLEVPDYITTPPAIVATRDVIGGMPRIDGTRIPVVSIQALARNRYRVEHIESIYPELTPAHIRMALDWRATKEEGDVPHFSGGPGRSVLTTPHDAANCPHPDCALHPTDKDLPHAGDVAFLDSVTGELEPHQPFTCYYDDGHGGSGYCPDCEKRSAPQKEAT